MTRATRQNWQIVKKILWKIAIFNFSHSWEKNYRGFKKPFVFYTFLVFCKFLLPTLATLLVNFRSLCWLDHYCRISPTSLSMSCHWFIIPLKWPLCIKTSDRVLRRPLLEKIIFSSVFTSCSVKNRRRRMCKKERNIHTKRWSTRV